MPRGRCHFALVLGLQERLERDLPEVGALNRQYLPDLVAGSMAPDAMRFAGEDGQVRIAFLYWRIGARRGANPFRVCLRRIPVWRIMRIWIREIAFC